MQSHALSFFHLSAPDLLLGMDSDPARRNVLGLVEKHPEIARDGIALRKFGQQRHRTAGGRAHPSRLDSARRSGEAARIGRRAIAILKELPEARAIAWRTLDLFKSVLDGFRPEIAAFGDMPTMYAGLVGNSGDLHLYDGRIRFKTPDGSGSGGDRSSASTPVTSARRRSRDSYLKAPYYKPLGYPAGIYRVGPLARLNVARPLRNARGRQGTAGVSPALRADRARARSISTMRG